MFFDYSILIAKCYIIRLDKSGYKINIFSYFSTKIYVVVTHQKCLAEALLMSNHNICFHREIRKISILLD